MSNEVKSTETEAKSVQSLTALPSGFFTLDERWIVTDDTIMQYSPLPPRKYTVSEILNEETLTDKAKDFIIFNTNLFNDKKNSMPELIKEIDKANG